MATRRSARAVGRPRQFEDPVTQPVRIERKDVKRARELAARDSVTLAEILRRAVKQYLKRRGV